MQLRNVIFMELLQISALESLVRGDTSQIKNIL